jgi:hypothetical protein
MEIIQVRSPPAIQRAKKPSDDMSRQLTALAAKLSAL